MGGLAVISVAIGLFCWDHEAGFLLSLQGAMIHVFM
jgi:hypothetical protein